MADEPPQQIALSIKDIDEPVSGAGNVICFIFVLQRIGHVEVRVDRGDAEWGVPGRKMRVSKFAVLVNGSKLRIKNVDPASVEIGGEQESAGLVEADCEPFVYRTGG